MTTLLAFILAIAVLVVIHELGHYGVARLCGVKVLRFSVGFGKPLFAKYFKGGETEWVISAIPLGGYVKMLDEHEGEVAAHELHRAFNRQPVMRRMFIVVAGPVSNLLLAIALYWGLFMYGVPGLKPILGEIVPATPAAVAQMQVEETVVSINGEPVPSWQDVRWTLLNLALRGAEAQIEGRTIQGETIRHVLDLKMLAPGDLDGDFMEKLGLHPYQPLVRPIIGQLTEGGVAERAGLRPDDLVLRVNGQSITRWKDLVDIVRRNPRKLLQFDIERDGREMAVPITPEEAFDAGIPFGRIGAAPFLDKKAFDALTIEVRYAPSEALRQALHNTWDTAVVSLQMLVKMVMGEISTKSLSGPISIADYAGQSAQLGVAAYLGFLALISVSLGVLNLLPIPLLDGGHLLYYMAELIKGSPVSEKAWEIGQNVGIALLFTLMALALYNDINRLILG